MQLFPSASQFTGRARVAAIAAVGVGGAAGVSLRWAVGTRFETAPATWPWQTLVVNVFGCLLIGLAAQRLERGSLQWDTVVTGLLGGFTTMSSFAVELNDLVDAERSGVALAYLAVTLVAGLAAVSGGLALGRRATEPAR